jgi:hypothetical protein
MPSVPGDNDESPGQLSSFENNYTERSLRKINLEAFNF